MVVFSPLSLIPETGIGLSTPTWQVIAIVSLYLAKHRHDVIVLRLGCARLDTILRYIRTIVRTPGRIMSVARTGSRIAFLSSTVTVTSCLRGGLERGSWDGCSA